jgi:hypothetical protein
MPQQTRHVASVPSPEARANVQAVPKGNVWRRHGISNGYYWESSEWDGRASCVWAKTATAVDA